MKNAVKTLILALALVGLGAGCTTVAYVPEAPPAAKKEVRPVRPGPAYIWVDGHWKWNGHRYAWVKGHWVKGKPGKEWVDGHWKRTAKGHVWVAGHWR